MRLTDDQLQLVRCPCPCKDELEFVEGYLTCASGRCPKRFPIVDGVPIVINEETSTCSIADYLDPPAESSSAAPHRNGAATIAREAYRKITYGLREFSVGLGYLSPADVIARMGAEKERATCLIVGCGDAEYDAPPNVKIVYTDIVKRPLAGMIADAHDLPFADGSFDLVIAAAVLQHVPDPQRCVAEFWRVLKDDGLVYAVSAFMQPVHGGAHDFTRFSHLGHVRLFRWFDELESGMALGPGSALGWSMQYFALSLTDSLSARKLLRLIGLIAALPLKFVDLLFRYRKGALDAAGGTFFWGRKRSSPIHDRDMIRTYRGLNAR